MNARRALVAGSIGVLMAAACSMLPATTDPVASPDAPRLQPRSRGRIASKQPLAIEWDRSSDRDFLTELAPRTLATGRRVLVGQQGTRAVALSPDRDLLMAAELGGTYRIIDVATMEGVEMFRPGSGGWPLALRWITPDRAVVLRANQWTTNVTVLDPTEGTVVRRTRFDGTPVRVRGAFGGFVVLAQEGAMSEEHHPARLVAISSDGDVRSVTLDRIPAGFAADDEDFRHGMSLSPALASRGTRAIVVGTDGTIAVVDLNDLEVSYPEVPRSLAERLTAALLPAAHAKMSEGVSLWARWIDEHVFALTGRRTDIQGRGDNLRMRTSCLPIRLLDTRDWKVHRWHGAGNGLEVADGLIITFDRCHDDSEPAGLTAYDGDGTVVWKALGKKNITGVTLRAGFAFVRRGYKRVLLSVVDLRDGRVLTTRKSFASILPY